MRNGASLEQHWSRRPRRWTRALAAVSGCAVLAMSGSAATGTSSDGTMNVNVKVDRSARLRVSTGRAILLPVKVWCSESTLGEIDAALEQKVPGRTRSVRAVRNIQVGCDPTQQRVVLAFETLDHFVKGPAVVRLDASGGFGEQFATVHVGPITVEVK